MLQHEITPFADAHIEALTAVLYEIAPLLGTTHAPLDTVKVDKDQVQDWYYKIISARSAIIRFKVCAEDEWKQKERYAKYAREHGYPFS